MAILSLALVLMFAQAPPAGFIAAGNADDQTDATCVKATDMAAQMARGDNLDNLLFVNAFYIGRLSGRATDHAWPITVTREADKNLDPANVGDVSARCQQRMRTIIKAR